MSEPTEVEALRAEVDSLQAQLTDKQSARRRRWRGIVAGILAVLAVLATVLSLLNLWAFRTLNNTELFVDRVGPVIEDQQVAEALGQAAATELVQALDLQQRLEQRLPEQLAVASGPVTAAATNWLAQGVTNLAETPRVQQAFETALGASHELAIGVLSGAETEALSTSDGQIVLDLTPVINELITQGSEFLSGVLDREIPAPSVTPENVEAAIAAIEQRLGVDLPADFGQVTLFESQNLATAQQAYQVARWSAVLAPIAALLLIALAVVVSTRRLRTFLAIVVGTALALLLAWLAVQPLKGSVLESVADQGLSGAVGSSLEILFSSLRSGIVIILVLGVVAAVLMFVTGDSRAAGRTRALVGQALSLAAQHRMAFLIGGAVVVLALLAAVPGRGWSQLGVGLLVYAGFALAVLLAPRPADDVLEPVVAEPA